MKDVNRREFVKSTGMLTGAIRGRPDEPITIAALSHTVRVSEQTLRNAFIDVHRKSPKRFASGYHRRVSVIRRHSPAARVYSM